MENIKEWKKMTEKDIQMLKRQQCCKCYYFSRNSENRQGDNYITGICDYVAIVGHSRGCNPLECKIKGIFRLREGKGKRRKGLVLYA